MAKEKEAAINLEVKKALEEAAREATASEEDNPAAGPDGPEEEK
jgi:hypothetical protein